MSDYFLIAKIVSVHGKEGFVRISSFSDFPERFFRLEKVFVDFFGNKKIFHVKEVKKVNDYFIIKFKNFNNENDVSVLLGKQIFVDSENVIKLPEDYFFVHDLIGSTVLKNNVEVGKIQDILNLPANDVYLIVDEQGNEILIPAVKDFIESFDPRSKVLILKPDRELYEDEQTENDI